MKSMRRQRGQMVMAEQVVVFFLVIAAIAGIYVYVQRALQARVRDAKVYMVDTASDACRQAGGECLNAAGASAGGKFAYEYEPYYGRVSSTVGSTQSINKVLNPDGTIQHSSMETTSVSSGSVQEPPARAKGAILPATGAGTP